LASIDPIARDGLPQGKVGLHWAQLYATRAQGSSITRGWATGIRLRAA